MTSVQGGPLGFIREGGGLHSSTPSVPLLPLHLVPNIKPSLLPFNPLSAFKLSPFPLTLLPPPLLTLNHTSFKTSSLNLPLKRKLPVKPFHFHFQFAPPSLSGVSPGCLRGVGLRETKEKQNKNRRKEREKQKKNKGKIKENRGQQGKRRKNEENQHGKTKKKPLKGTSRDGPKNVFLCTMF